MTATTAPPITTISSTVQNASCVEEAMVAATTTILAHVAPIPPEIAGPPPSGPVRGAVRARIADRDRPDRLDRGRRSGGLAFVTSVATCRSVGACRPRIAPLRLQSES